MAGVECEPGGVTFFQLGGMGLVLFGRAALEDTGLPEGRGFGGVALAHNVGTVRTSTRSWSERGRRGRAS